MFQIGVALFEKVFKFLPFSKNNGAVNTDPLFKHFYSNPLNFWKNKTLSQRLCNYKNKIGSDLANLMDLITKLLHANPKERITAE